MVARSHRTLAAGAPPPPKLRSQPGETPGFLRKNGWAVRSAAVEPIAVAVFIAIVAAVIAAVLVPIIWFFVVAAGDDGDSD